MPYRPAQPHPHMPVNVMTRPYMAPKCSWPKILSIAAGTLAQSIRLANVYATNPTAWACRFGIRSTPLRTRKHNLARR